MREVMDSVPLWRQLQVTASVIQAVRGGASGTAAIDRVDTPLRPGVQALAFHVWRNLGRAQALRKLLASRAPAPAVDALLCSALALAWNPDDSPYEIFTLVNQAVEAAKRSASMKAQAGFVNGCLRRFLRERLELVQRTDADEEALWNHPTWWVRRLKHEYPLHWQAILGHSNRQAPMILRVNARKCSQDQYREMLQAAGVGYVVLAGGAIVLEQAMPVMRIPGFAEGMVSVQDAAAQMAAPLLVAGMPRSGSARILDACAAPGGKTGHLLELVDADVTALEVDPIRAQRIGQNLDRLGLRARVVTADASKPDTWWDGQLFDAILLDAPCTASGIVRRHPDVRWLRREADIAQLAAVQKQMLMALWPLVKPGGRLVYCTCSLFQAEGRAQVQAFLAHNTDAALQPSPGHLYPCGAPKTGALPDNQSSDHDGFFYALLEKHVGT